MLGSERSLPLTSDLAFAPAVQRLMARAIRPLPLTREMLKDRRVGERLDPLELFPHARDSAAAAAGLALQLGDWETAHRIAQDVNNREGSYWHAILHRMEPDYANANYWFGRVGAHPLFEQLAPYSATVLEQSPKLAWKMSVLWQPRIFSEWVQSALESGDAHQLEVAQLIQQFEIEQLFAFCNHR